MKEEDLEEHARKAEMAAYDEEVATAVIAADDADAADYDEQKRLREELLENFFDALGRKRNREILNYLLENGPKKYAAVMKFCMVSKEFHTPSNDELKNILQRMGRGGLISINEDRELHSTIFAEMALAAIGVAVNRLELSTSK